MLVLFFKTRERWPVFQWLLSLFGYNPRGLFQFHDGRRRRKVDPLDVTRRLFDAKDFDWDETPKLLQTGLAPIQLEAFGAIAKAVRAAFDLPTVDRGGLTETECLELLARFRDYLGDVKKNGSLFPISPVSTESQSSEEVFPTKPGSGFGLTEAAPSTEPPGSPAEAMFGNLPTT